MSGRTDWQINKWVRSDRTLLYLRGGIEYNNNNNTAFMTDKPLAVTRQHVINNCMDVSHRIVVVYRRLINENRIRQTEELIFEVNELNSTSWDVRHYRAWRVTFIHDVSERRRKNRCLTSSYSLHHINVFSRCWCKELVPLDTSNCCDYNLFHDLLDYISNKKTFSRNTEVNECFLTLRQS